MAGLTLTYAETKALILHLGGSVEGKPSKLGLAHQLIAMCLSSLEDQALAKSSLDLAAKAGDTTKHFDSDFEDVIDELDDDDVS